MKVLILKDDISLISVEDDSLLLDVASRCYYELNEPALFLLRLLEGGCSQEQLKANMVTVYSIDQQTAASDIDRFIAELSRFDLLETREEAVAPVKSARPAKDNKAYQAPLLRPEAGVLCDISGTSTHPANPSLKP